MTDAKTWAKRVTDWRASGLTASEYCSGRGFSRTALYWWSSKLREDGPDTSEPRETVPMARREGEKGEIIRRCGRHLRSAAIHQAVGYRRAKHHERQGRRATGTESQHKISNRAGQTVGQYTNNYINKSWYDEPHESHRCN